MSRLREGSWVGDAIVNGRRIRRSFATRKEADNFEREPCRFLGVEPTTNKVGKLFPIWAREIYGRTRNEKNSLRDADELVQAFGKETSVEKIDRAKIRAYVADLKGKKKANSTINNKLAVLSRLLKYACEERIINDPVAINFLPMTQGRIRSLTHEEEDKLMENLKDEYRHYANFLLYTGCRVSEALTLEWSDIDGDAVTFWRTKTDRPRTVPLTSRATQALTYTKAQGWKRPFEQVVYISFLHAWNRAKTAAGLGHDKQVVPHVLRHTCATRLSKAKTDPLRMQEWLGHSTLQMTARYTHLDVSDLRIGATALER